MWCDILGIKSVDAICGFLRARRSFLARRPSARPGGGRCSGAESACRRCSRARSITAFANLLRSLPPRDFDFRQVVRMGSRHAEKCVFAINNTGIFLTLSHRLDENLSITALQLFDPLIKRENLPAISRGDRPRICPIDPRGSAPRPVRPARVVQRRRARVRDSPPARGGRRGRIRRLRDRYMDPRLSRNASVGSDRNLRTSPIGGGWSCWTGPRSRSGRKSFWDFIADRAIVRRFYRRRQIANTVPEPRLCRGAGL